MICFLNKTITIGFNLFYLKLYGLKCNFLRFYFYSLLAYISKEIKHFSHDVYCIS